jgi:Ferritin-like
MKVDRRGSEVVEAPSRSVVLPQGRDPGFLSEPAAALLDEADVDPLVAAVAELGVPRGPADVRHSPRAEAVFFLQVAAEVEHALLAQYLYAAYSLDADHAGDWQSAILEIAKEEMGHLITVQNLLVLLGADPYFERENYPLHTDLYPFALHLEPLHRQSLARYVIAESPFAQVVPDELQPVAEQAGNVNHVGVIYAMLYWIFQTSDAPEGPHPLPDGLGFPSGHHLVDGDFVHDVALRQTTRADWGGGNPAIHIDPADSRAAALNALSTIAIQGEGVTDDDDSHFHRFLTIYRGMVTKIEQGDTTFALDVPTDPTTTGVTSGAVDVNRITHPDTVRWATLFNLRYEALMLDIILALSYRSDDVVDGGVKIRTRLARDWGVRKEMRTAIAQIAQTLTSAPKDEVPGPPGTPRFAGAPFELPAAGYPVDRLGCWTRQLAVIDECAGLITAIGLDHDDEFGTLQDLQAFDTDRRAFVAARVAQETT